MLSFLAISCLLSLEKYQRRDQDARMLLFSLVLPSRSRSDLTGQAERNGDKG